MPPATVHQHANVRVPTMTVSTSAHVYVGSQAQAGYYAATNGSASGAGTIGDPWDLQTALNGGPSNEVQPGDTVWVRGGTYNGLYVATTAGSSGAPILFKPYANEQPTINGYVTGTLTSGMDDTQTTVPMARLNAPAAAYGSYSTTVDIDSEQILLGPYSGSAYTGCERHWGGTSAAAHSSGATVYTDAGQCLSLQGNYTHVYGIETKVGTSRYSNRDNPDARGGEYNSNPFGRAAGGIDVRGTGNKAINCFAHDCSDGFSASNAPTGYPKDYAFYGCIGYYNGWDGVDRGHGHNFYLHNDDPSNSLATLGACISLDSFDIGAQIYTGGDTLGNVQVDGFIGAQAGKVSSYGAVTEFLTGFSPGPITTSSLTDSAFYASGATGGGVSVGYASGYATDFTLTGNYSAAQDACCVVKAGTTFTATSGNTWVGPSSAPNPASGTFLDWKPGSGTAIVYCLNTYEAGRAHIAVFNWDHTSTVVLDFSSFLSVGDPYVVLNAWDFFGAPVASGTYSGSNVTVNTSGLTVSAPVGLTAPVETGTEFNVYIVRRREAGYFAATTGSAGGSGSISAPWDLQTALDGGPSNEVQPGDTVWVRGGTYNGQFTSSLAGTSGSRITVRNYRNERATIDGNGYNDTAPLSTGGGYTDYWGLEVTNSASSPSGLVGVHDTGSLNRFINCIVHDTAASGLCPWDVATGTEMYGCLVYYCGDSTSLDHGTYTHDATGDSRLIKHSLFLNNRTYGLQIYGTSAAKQDNYTLDGVISAGNGDMGGAGGNRNLQFGGANTTVNPIVKNSVFHSRFDGSEAGTSFMFGWNYGGGTSNGQILDNYIADNGWIYQNSGLTMTGNTIYYNYAFVVDNGGQGGFPSNTWTTNRPTGSVVKVYPNTYEAGRGNVAIFNWSGASTVAVDVSSILTSGDQYEVRNALDYYGTPLLSGTWTSGTLAFPTTALTPSTPVRHTAPAHGHNEFNAYVVVKTG